MIHFSFLLLFVLLHSSVRDVCGRPIIEQETIEKVATLKDKFMRDIDSGVHKAKTFLADKFSRIKDYFRQQDPSGKEQEGMLKIARLNDNGFKAVKKSHHVPNWQKVR